jgi:hypothetical protein
MGDCPLEISKGKNMDLIADDATMVNVARDANVGDMK